MTFVKKTTTKMLLLAGMVCVVIAEIASAPHTWFFWYEEDCPEELIKDK